MAKILTMPKVGMLEGEIELTKWLRQEGDIIAEGEFIAEIESEKTTTQIESFEKGTILKILIHEGDIVPIGAKIAVVGTPGEDYSALLDD
jgi:pyruvate dehydrogenase E2 component (dihydrolipoamide acetyltransferase)